MSQEQTKLTSLQNPRVKEVVKLRKRSYRDEKGLFLIEGYRELSRAIENGWMPIEFFYCEDLFLGKNERPLLTSARRHGATVYACTESVFRKLAYRDRPEGLIATCEQRRRSLDELDLPARPLIVVAEAIEKPGNLGSILRSADAAGVDAVIVCDGGTDIFNPNTVRASIGTLFTVPVAEAKSEDVLDTFKTLGIHTVATTPDAEQMYSDANLTDGVAIIVGAEQYGISRLWMERADARVRIPMHGQSDSLNVAAATTIMLYEAERQRRKRTSNIEH